jgi:antitoxin (DNA-binding transcriptional repressor) of toxin-antitoxin stability system
MEKATISDLKNQLSAYLAKVKAGASVLILDRDQPVARLERVEPGRQGDDRLGRLERAGIIRRGTGAVPAVLLRRPVAKPTRSLVQALLEEREEGR